jgi:hypothetical protein
VRPTYYLRAFKRGFKVGLGEVVDEKEENCLNDSDVCESLGDDAAAIIGRSNYSACWIRLLEGSDQFFCHSGPLL